MGNIVHIVDSNIIQRIAQINIEQLSLSLKVKEEVTWVLSGGNTPKLVFKEILKTYKNVVEWHRIVVFWSDERFVHSDNEESNYGVAKREFIDFLPFKNVYPIKIYDTPQETALRYETILNNYFKGNNWSFDVLFLGVGKDGHIASLFPSSSTLINTNNCVVFDSDNKLPQPRISLSLNSLNNGYVKIFGVGDVEKEEVVRKAFQNKNPELPFSLLDFDMGLYYLVFA